MPSIIYGGVRYNQTRHAIFCKNCKDTIESRHNYDFKLCKCRAIGIDGGIGASNRILGNLTDMEIRDVYCTFVNKKRILLPQEVVDKSFAELITKSAAS